MLTAAGHRALLGAMAFLAVAALVVVLVGGGGGEPSSVSAGDPRPTVAPSTTGVPEGDGSAATATTVPDSTTTALTTAAPTTTAVVPEVRVPVGAVGAFTVAPGQTPVVGTGELVTYTVEVEDAVGYSAPALARFVDQTLGDPRSWTGDGSVAFQRVPSGGQVRIVLATPATVDQLCLPLVTAGVYSCHQAGTVALNSNRWFNGSHSWPGPIEAFRRYAINHEVGHAIGHGHVSCPGAGQPAPIMMQQSKGLEGCLPNGWVFPG